MYKFYLYSPSSISTSKISHVTEDGDWSGVCLSRLLCQHNFEHNMATENEHNFKLFSKKSTAGIICFFNSTMWTIFVISYWIYFSWLNYVSRMFVSNNELRLRWIHCDRCNVSWFQALLVRLASELTEIQDKRWCPPRRTDPRTLLVLQAMSYKEPRSLRSVYWNRLKENIAKEVHQIQKTLVLTTESNNFQGKVCVSETVNCFVMLARSF